MCEVQGCKQKHCCKGSSGHEEGNVSCVMWAWFIYHFQMCIWIWRLYDARSPAGFLNMLQNRHSPAFIFYNENNIKRCCRHLYSPNPVWALTCRVRVTVVVQSSSGNRLAAKQRVAVKVVAKLFQEAEDVGDAADGGQGQGVLLLVKERCIGQRDRITEC